MLRSLALLLAAPFLAFVLAGMARADSITLEFDRVTTNSSIDLSSQLSVVVSDLGGGDVLFAVYNGNGGTVASSICDIYWGLEVNSGTANASVAGVLGPNVDFLAHGESGSPTTSGVSFSNGAKPQDPPGLGKNWAGAAADSDSPVAANGIGLNEAGGFVLSMLSGTDWDDIVQAFDAGLLRMAFHIQGIGGAGKSDTYQSVVPVPEPGSLLLVGGALGLAALRRRRRAGTSPARS